MLATIFSVKFIIVYIFILSAVFIHFRGKVRFKFFRQLFDHTTFMAPINSVFYLSSAVPNKAYLDINQFPQLAHLRENWEVMRDEAKKLVEQGYIKASDNYDDIGFNSFFRTGWKRFYIKWYEDYLPSAKELCPKTIELLKNTQGMNAAMFAMLPKGGRLVRHRDPYAGSIRYHLGLITPNSDNCYINVDGTEYYWQDGKDVVFDETFIHYAENKSDMDRIILFCDVERPLNNGFARAFNKFCKKFIMAAAATKNTDGDKVGGINKAFKYFYAIRRVGKRFKKFNKPLYVATKYALYGGIIYLVLFK